MADELLDDFGDVSGWSAVASGQAGLALGRDAGPDGRAAGRRPTSSRSSSSIRAVATSGGGTETPSRCRRTGSRCASAAARWRSRGGPPAAARRASSAPSRWRSPRGPAEPARSGSPTCASRTSLLRARRASRHRARRPGHAPAHALDPSPATSWRSAGGAPQWLARLRPRGPAHLVGAARLHAAAEWAGCPRARAGAGTASAARRLDRTPAAPPPARARGGHGVPVDDFDADGVTLGRGSHVVMRLRA
jgi:hypothetical protein